MITLFSTFNTNNIGNTLNNSKYNNGVVFLKNNLVNAHTTQGAKITPSFGASCDNFSVLDKYEENYKHSFLKNIFSDLKVYLSKSKNLSEFDIKGILDQGGLSIVFDLGGKGCLKCSLENPLEFREHNGNFDIPFLSSVEKINDTYIVQEVKADTSNVTQDDCIRVINEIKKAGYEISQDFDEYKTRQVGKYDGKPYLLDTRCAVPKPNKWSEFIYKFYRDYNRIHKLKRMSPEAIAEEERKMSELAKKYGPKVYHIVELPRRNISFQEGLNVIIKVLKGEYVELKPWNIEYSK